MDSRAMSRVAVGLLIGMAVGFLWMLLYAPTPVTVERRVTDIAAERAAGTLPGGAPGGTGAAAGAVEVQGAAATAPVESVRIEGERQMFDGRPGEAAGRWTSFRGEDFQNGAEVVGGFLESWPESGPPVLWRVKLGEGYAGPAVRAGRVFVLDYDEDVGGDALRCFSFADGREIWRRTYRAPIKKNHGFSRTVPAVTEQHVVTLGPRCIAMCVRPADGTFLWGADLVAVYGTEVPLWYTGQNPVIDDGVAVFAPGGQALLVGLDCETGREVWRTPNPDGWKMSHSSVLVTTLLGRRMYVYCAKEGIVGVSAAAADRGRVLWKTAAWAHAVTSPSPVSVGDGRLFLTAGYGGGSMMLELSEHGGGVEAKPLYELAKTVFSCEQHTPLLHREHLFAVLPKDAGENRAQLACLGLDGRLVWTSGKTERFGLGPFLRLGERILVLADDGTLTLARASLTAYERLARARVLHGREAWAPLAWVDGRLLARDFEEMICLDLRATAGPTAVAGKGS